MISEEQQALEFARTLQAAVHPEVVKALRVRARTGTTPLARRAALLALEGRDADVWWDPVTLAFCEDADATVRGDAADILARALADPRHAAVHAALREILIRGLTRTP
ncbi:MAG: hypothetical protein P1V36_04290 [Planctomycetota bacterium]|nr:hypothetical protein [Planctomycetota bacterium]